MICTFIVLESCTDVTSVTDHVCDGIVNIVVRVHFALKLHYEIRCQDKFGQSLGCVYCYAVVIFWDM